MKKLKGFYATLSTGKEKKVYYLQPYYYQGGKWFKVRNEKPLKKGGKI